MSYDKFESLKRRYLALRSVETVRVLRIQDEIVSEIRAFLKGEGFVEILAPIIGPVTDPGIRGAKQVSIDYYGAHFKVMSSMILYKQMMIISLPKIFALSPNVRLEPLETVKTRRHLTEFRQIDLEVAYATYKDVMELGERMLCHVITKIKRKCGRELKEQKRDLKVPQRSFKKYTYKEALEILENLGIHVKHGLEIPWEAEEALSKIHNEPFWITDFPTTARGFYYMEHEDNPEILKDFDLIYPEGFGEAVSGGEREHQYAKILERMRMSGEEVSEYKWYLNMLKVGVPPSAGFGIGVERLTRFICGLENIWDAVPFPKVAGVYSP
ncbi:MAG: asparagine synthetase A [Candidatus Bathyarchaeota archaeon]|nr:asparagine synthetase A [Candidatus Bathyarchaeota archaeon]